MLSFVVYRIYGDRTLTSIFWGRNTGAEPFSRRGESLPSSETENGPWIMDVAPYAVTALPLNNRVADAPFTLVRLILKLIRN